MQCYGSDLNVSNQSKVFNYFFFSCIQWKITDKNFVRNQLLLLRLYKKSAVNVELTIK